MAKRRLIEAITLRTGNGTTIIKPGAVTVLVGPNNSGKSLLLRELAALVANNAPGMFVDSLIPCARDTDEAREYLRDFIVDRGHPTIELFSPSGQGGLSREHLEQYLSPSRWFSTIGQFITLLLGGAERLRMVDPAPIEAVMDRPSASLPNYFLRDQRERESLRATVHDTLGKFLTIDAATNAPQLHFRLSDRAPVDEDEEVSTSRRARDFHRPSLLLQSQSDGIKAAVGMLVASHLHRAKLILVDEPEAFLHPPLSRAIGRSLATTADRRDGHLFLATHSADVLAGCVGSGADVTILRLERNGEHTTVTSLDADSVTALMRSPYLRSTSVLQALFHKSVVICEADADRAFYGEVNHRLLASKRTAANDALFLPANGKSGVVRLLAPLRALGVPAAAIVDIDLILSKGEEWSRLLAGAGIPEASRHALGQHRGDLRATMEQAFGPNEFKTRMKKDGVAALPADAKGSFRDFQSNFARYGVFVAPHELEGWLKQLGIPTGDKTSWINDVLEQMGSDPSSASYLRPAEDDVWKFVEGVAAWVLDPGRAGMIEQ